MKYFAVRTRTNSAYGRPLNLLNLTNNGKNNRKPLLFVCAVTVFWLHFFPCFSLSRLFLFWSSFCGSPHCGCPHSDCLHLGFLCCGCLCCCWFGYQRLHWNHHYHQAKILRALGKRLKQHFNISLLSNPCWSFQNDKCVM